MIEHCGVTLDRRSTFDNQASVIALLCNYHKRAIFHIWHLLMLDLAQMLVYSLCLILLRIDYSNSVLHGAPSSTIQKLQRVQNNAMHIVLQAPWRSDINSLLQTLHWLPVEQRINYKLTCWRSRLNRHHLCSIWASHLVAHQCTQHLIIVRPTAVRAILTDIICQTVIQLCRTSDLELTATCCVKLRFSVYFQIQT